MSSPDIAGLRQAIVAEALTWLGTPYHHQAGIKGVGCDCAYLLIRVYRALGLIPEIDPGPYPPDWHLHRNDERYLGWVRRFATAVATPRPGDAALWRFGRTASHGGIVVAWPTIIHAYRGQGVVLADATQAPLGESGRLVGVYTLLQGKTSEN